MTERNGDTAPARRAARISAARALVKVQQQLGKASLPSVVALANAAPDLQERGADRRVSP